MIHLENAYKNYEDCKVLQGLTFSIKRGEILGFIGANGSGKTTTMRAIMGMLKLESGEIEIDGQIVGQRKKLSTFLGYLPEERGLYMNESIHSQLYFFGELQGMKRAHIELRIDYLLMRLQIGKYRNSRLRELSLGNQQRAQIAVALLHNPRYLIFDEPFNGLDPTGTQAVLELLQQESNAGAGIMFSSHILPYVEDISDRILILSSGQAHVYDKTRSALQSFYDSFENKNAE